MTTPFILGQLR